MSLLDQLWDDTVAGPPPETGLGKLRKHPTFGFRSNSGKEMDAGIARSYSSDTSPDDAVKVTRSIMIVKPPAPVGESGTPPASPAGSTPPVSPFGFLLDTMLDKLRMMEDFLSILNPKLDVRSGQEGKNPSGFVGGLHRMLMRRQVGLELGALVLLKTCEI